MTNQLPFGAQYYVDGLYYKVGIHNYVYLYIGGSWMKSSHSVEDLDGMKKTLVNQDNKRKETLAKKHLRYLASQNEAEKKRKKQQAQKRKSVIKRKKAVRGRR